MRRGILILVLGVVGAAIACRCFYLMGTATPRALMRSAQPELAWLKHEFNLGDAEFTRITSLHDDYQPHCAEMCRRIDEQGARLKTLLTTTNAMTPEIEAALAESTKLRADCQRDMLQHFFAVSQTMPPAQGRRYLEWISERTFIRAHGGMSAMGH